jgi:hypothetical protein
LFVKESTVAYRDLQTKWQSADVYQHEFKVGIVHLYDSMGGIVGVSEILAQIDREIAQLQEARALLSGGAKKTTKKAAKVPAARKVAKKKRNLTPEGRKRIAEAVKRRWAEQRKASGGK